MKKEASLAIVVLYLALFAAGLMYLSYYLVVFKLNEFEDFRLALSCILLGGAGGIMYCLRGAYFNYCVKKNWSNDWIPWYIIRPFVSMMCGGISYLFLKAGLLILEAQKESDASNLGFYTFAFIAGMNVDNFIKKVEEIAETTWGIAKSRSSSNQE